MVCKKITGFSIVTLMTFMFGILAFEVFAQSVGGGDWNVGYCDGSTIYSEYLHKTKPHGASTQVWDNDEDDWSTERICAPRGAWARSEQFDPYKGKMKHGHGFWHRCGIEISNCGGAFGNFD